MNVISPFDKKLFVAFILEHPVGRLTNHKIMKIVQNRIKPKKLIRCIDDSRNSRVFLQERPNRKSCGLY